MFSGGFPFGGFGGMRGGHDDGIICFYNFRLRRLTTIISRYPKILRCSWSQKKCHSIINQKEI